jgi:hypothetical protein
MSMQPPAEVPLEGFTQQLGRHAWFLIHTTAKGVACDADLANFKTFVHALLACYPCARCRKGVATHCAALIHALGALSLGDLTPGRPANYSAAVWAAKLHACVTVHVDQQQREQAQKGAWVSRTSVALARAVQSCADDASVYQLVEALNR